MVQPDNDIIMRFKQGDPLAFTAIYNEYHHTIYYFVKKFIQDRNEAEDITAETFVKLWKLHANFDNHSNIKAFLYITSRNACLNFFRYRQRQGEREKDLLYTLLQQPSETVLQDEVKAEVLKLIYREIEKLPRSCRKVFKMAYLDGLSNDEIATALGINNQSVRNNKARAIKLLRIAVLNKNMVLYALLCTCIPALHFAD